MDHRFTRHTRIRMSQRSIKEEAIDLAQDYGLCSHVGGQASVHLLGYRQIQALINKLEEEGTILSKAERLDLLSYEGTIVIEGDDGRIVTAIKNRNFRLKRDFRSSVRHRRRNSHRRPSASGRRPVPHRV